MKILFYINLGFFNYNLLTKKLQQYKFSEKKEKHNQYKFLQNNKFNNNQKNYLLYGSLLIGVSLILILISIYCFKSKNQKELRNNHKKLIQLTNDIYQKKKKNELFFKLNDEFFNKNKNLVPVRLFAIKIKTKNDEYDEKSKIHDMTDGNFFQIKIPYKIHQEKLKIFNISYRSQRIIEIYINDIPDLTNKKEYIDYIDQLKKFDPIKKLIELIDTININNFTSKEYNDEENINKFLNIFNELLQNKNFIEQLSPK